MLLLLQRQGSPVRDARAALAIAQGSPCAIRTHLSCAVQACIDLERARVTQTSILHKASKILLAWTGAVRYGLAGVLSIRVCGNRLANTFASMSALLLLI